jgi:phosphatidylglycerophosphatase A
MNGQTLLMVKNKRFSLSNELRRLGASLFYLGYIPYISGTIGSAVAIGALWYLNNEYPAFFSSANIIWHWIALVALTGISILFSSKSKEVFGSDDPSPVVIDEVAGQCVTFFLIPLSLPTLIVGFVLFRFFDIVKPFPVYKLEEVEGGVGITMDDIAAGVLANISLMALLACYEWIKVSLHR